MAKYVKYDPLTHVLERPDMYVGSCSERSSEELVFENERLSYRTISFCPALIRCFSEILNNAVDNAERPGKMSKIDIELSETSCVVWNDGAVIPIEKHSVHGIYNHTLIFGHLLSGSNYDDSEARFVTGRNGLGAKLANIFSTKFRVEGTDPTNRLKLIQTWKNNMKTVTDPVISSFAGKRGYTKISFALDLKRFGCEKFSRDTIALISRLILDAAMTTGLKVSLNSVNFPNELKNYFNLIDEEPVPALKFDVDDLRVSVSVSRSGQFEAISFVNCMPTKNGGKHVDAVAKAICAPIVAKIPSVTTKDVKKRLRVLVAAKIKNPCFESQEKNSLEAPAVKIPPFAPAKINKLLKLELASGITLERDLKSLKEDKDKKNVSKSVAAKSLAIEGYDKANFASTSKAKQCVLIICEGLSAKTFAVAGIETGAFGKKGRNYFGIYPLRGKLLNVRNASCDAIAKNVVLTNLMKILRLKYEQPDNFDKLSYGSACLLSDADKDGIHIEGLVLNFFHTAFPKLLEKGFVSSMKTPILSITKPLGKTVFVFDEQTDYSSCKGKIKYIKGLGTTKASDVKAVFGKKILKFECDGKEDEVFKKSFDKNETDARKRWIESYDPNSSLKSLDSESETIIPRFVSDHLDSELVKFFLEDCFRTLPSIYDGLKESQRKILFAAKKRKLTSDLKVAQLGAYVAEQTSYHHGETNLFKAIVKMAQSFPGSNNVPLLAAEGMFGTRLSGGEDAASPRYIYTKMTDHCQTLFPDSDVYEKVMSEGSEIEPEYYVPVLPVLLLNGSVGIASGWMCSCPSFSIQDVKRNSRAAMNGHEIEELIPQFNGFVGKIEKVKDKFLTRGIFERKKNVIVVSELPVGLWNDKFKQSLEEDSTILDIKDFSTPEVPRFELVVDEEKFDESKFEKRLTTTVHVNNISVLIKKEIKTVSVTGVFETWAEKRLEFNEKRKKRLIAELTESIAKEKETMKFIRLVREKKINVTKSESNVKRSMELEGIKNHSLLDLPLKRLTEDFWKKCSEKLEALEKEKTEIESLSIVDMWENDVAKLSF